MKTLVFIIALMLPIISLGQMENKEYIMISEPQEDDVYQTSKTINVIAPVLGDVVLAGSNIVLNDSIHEDVLVAGGEIHISGFVGDDVRAAGGKLTIDAEVEDDVIVAGGELVVTENAVIMGNLINFSGTIEMNGTVKGIMRSHSGKVKMNGTVDGDVFLTGEDIHLNGEINGTSRIISDHLIIGDNARFHKKVTYWNEQAEVDFKQALIGTTATRDESLMKDLDEFSWRGFEITAFWFWMLYLPSIFLILLLLNWPFHQFFSRVSEDWNRHFWRSLGVGLLYLIGMPVLILLCFVIIIGIPVGIFLSFLYIFSILFGHVVTALLASHYLASRQGGHRKPVFILLIALLLAMIFRLLIFIPVLGILLAVIINAVGYGLLLGKLFRRRTKAEKIL